VQFLGKHPGSFRATSVQFQSNFRAVSVQFQCNSVQFQCHLRVVFRAVPVEFRCQLKANQTHSARALSVHFQCNFDDSVQLKLPSTNSFVAPDEIKKAEKYDFNKEEQEEEWQRCNRCNRYILMDGNVAAVVCIISCTSSWAMTSSLPVSHLWPISDTNMSPFNDATTSWFILIQMNYIVGDFRFGPEVDRKCMCLLVVSC